MIRKLVAVILLAGLAACTSSSTITAVDEQPSLGGGIATSGG
jgi:hypothetical protein